jgi:hypothetical protein
MFNETGCIFGSLTTSFFFSSTLISFPSSASSSLSAFSSFSSISSSF